MPFLENNGNKLFYEVSGQGAKTLFFIHGLCGDHNVWLKNVPFFNDEFKVVTVDMFGHGNSAISMTPPKTFEAYTTIIKKLIEKENLANVVILGHSIAGNILSNCIEQDLEKIIGYVFIDCAFNATQRVVDSRNKLAETLLQNSDEKLGFAIEAWYKTMLDMTASAKDNELILSGLNSINQKWVLGFLKATNFIRQAPRTKLPVLVLESSWLTKDQPERSFYKVMPNSQYFLWEVSNHFFFVYDSEKFNKKLKDFLYSNF